MASATSDPEEWEATHGVEVKGKGVMDTFLWREEVANRLINEGQMLPQPILPSVSPQVRDVFPDCPMHVFTYLLFEDTMSIPCIPPLVLPLFPSTSFRDTRSIPCIPPLVLP